MHLLLLTKVRSASLVLLDTLNQSDQLSEYRETPPEPGLIN
jgi:hypothetical protein